MIIRRALAYVLVTILHPAVWLADLCAGIRPRARLRTAYREVRTLFS